MRNKVKAKKDSGITLVALIITIIILVILAAVTLKALFNDKLVETAIKAGEDYKIAQGQEMNELGKVNNKLINVTAEIGKGEVSKPSGIVGAISFGELTWNDGKASVMVIKNSEDSYTIEYKVTNKDNVVTREYAEVASGEIITDLSLGDLVTARLTDGTNHSKPADLNVLDENAPQVTLKLKEGVGAKGKKATVVATVIENESGVASYKFEYKLGTEDSYKSDSNGTITTSEKTKEYEYTNLTEEVVNNLRVLVTDNAGNSNTATCNVTPVQVLNTTTDPSLVGKTVEYIPDIGVFNTEGKKSTDASGSDEYSGAGFQYFRTQGQESNETAFTWKIWKADSEYLYLIADKGTTKYLKLQGVNGYNNGVKLLDDICNNCYSNSSYGATARNLKIEDIFETAANFEPDGVNGQYGSPGFTFSFDYPAVFAEHENTIEKAIANASVPYPYSNNAKISLSNCRPTLTGVNNTGITAKSFKGNYGQILIGTLSASDSYWLSSRSIIPNSSISCSFNLALMRKTQLCYGANHLYTYGFQTNYESKQANSSIRPLIMIPQNKITLSEENNDTFSLLPAN